MILLSDQEPSIPRSLSCFHTVPVPYYSRESCHLFGMSYRQDISRQVCLGGLVYNLDGLKLVDGQQGGQNKQDKKWRMIISGTRSSLIYDLAKNWNFGKQEKFSVVEKESLIFLTYGYSTYLLYELSRS